LYEEMMNETLASTRLLTRTTCRPSLRNFSTRLLAPMFKNAVTMTLLWLERLALVH
jgi:hypothetical protein